jgi:hypothetical protein
MMTTHKEFWWGMVEDNTELQGALTESKQVLKSGNWAQYSHP